MQPDEYDSVAMMCNLEILTCLATGLTTRLPVRWPDVEEVASWTTAYLKVWDAYIDRLAPEPEHKKKRRDVVVATFERFQRVAASMQRLP